MREDDVQMIGMLDDIVTITRFIVTPFVGLFPYPYAFRISPIEIAELIEVPLSNLLDDRCFSERFIFREGQREVVFVYQYGLHQIWGATARILKQFLDLIPNSLPATDL